MADITMKGTLQLDVDGVKTNSEQAASSLQTVQKAIIDTEKALKSGLGSNPLAPVNAGARTLSQSLNSLKVVGSSTSNSLSSGINQVSGSTRFLQQSITQISGEIPNFFQSARIGFMSIGNNIQPITQAIKGLRAEGKSTAQIFSTVAGSFFGWQTLLLVGVGLISAYGDRLFKMESRINSAKEAADSLGEAVSKDTEYSNAVQNVAKLTAEVKLAKDGFISKQGVVDHYNNTIGKTVGVVSDLNGVEDSLVKNAGAYIEATKQKAIATAAYSQWAQGVIDSQKKIRDAQKEAVQAIDAFREIYKDDPTRLTRNLDKIQSDFKKTIDGIKKDSESNNFFKKLGDDATNAAARISAAGKFNFFGDNKKDKVKKNAKEVVDALTQMDKTFEEIDINASLHVTHLSEVASLKLAAVEKAISAIGKAGGDTSQLSNLLNHLQIQTSDKDVINVKPPKIKYEVPKVDPSIKTGIQKQYDAIAHAQDEAAKEAQKRIESIQRKNAQLIGGTISDLSSAIGNAVGSGDFKNIGSDLLVSLGNAIKSFGEQIVVKVAAFLALKKTLFAEITAGNWVAALATGSGLIALGSAIAAFAQKGKPDGSSGNEGSFNRSSGASYVYTPSTSAYASANTGNSGASALVSSLGSIPIVGETRIENDAIVVAYQRGVAAKGR